MLLLQSNLAAPSLPYGLVFGTGTPNAQTFTTGSFTPPANCTMYVGIRGGRAGHLGTFAWAVTESSGTLGAFTTDGTGPIDGGSGNSFARQMNLGHWDVGGSPPSNITITVDAWSTTDVGAYIVAVVFVDPTLSLNGSVAYDFASGSTCSPSLGAATSGATFAIGFAEDDAQTATWNTPDAGWSTVVSSSAAYYTATVLLDPSGDADGATTVSYTGGSPNTVSGLIFELTAGGTLFTQNLSGSVGSSGALTRQAQKPLAGTVASSGVLTRRTAKGLAGSVASSSTLATARVVLLALAGSVGLSGVLTRQTSRGLGGTVASSGALSKQDRKLLAGTVASTSTLSVVKAILRTFTGSVGVSGILTRQTRKPLAGVLTSSGVLTRRPGKALAGAVASSGVLTVRRVILRTFTGTVGISGALVKQPRKLLASALASGGSLLAQLQATGVHLQVQHRARLVLMRHGVDMELRHHGRAALRHLVELLTPKL